MTKRRIALHSIALHIGMFAVAAIAAGCGPNLTSTPAGPTGPTTLSPLLLPRLDGVWGGDLTLTGIAGGTGPARTAGALACVGAAFGVVIGESNRHNLSIAQAGTALTARLTSAGTGLACTYGGRVGSGGTVVLDASACATTPLVFRCPNGEVLELEFVSSSITATIDAPVRVTSLAGTAAHTYNVNARPPGITQEQGLVVNHSFSSMTRR